MRLEVDIKRNVCSGKRSFLLQVKFKSQAQRVVLFGPSGSGKSLTLKAVAGLLRPEQGKISLDGRTFFESETGTYLSPQERHVGYVFQDYALFPQLSVWQNVAFGLKKGWFNPSNTEFCHEVDYWLEALQLKELAWQLPCELSGGQKQRTALARALVTRPRVLLLDEPFAALDPKLRHRLRSEVDELLFRIGVPIIAITHDPDDAMIFGEEVFWLENGVVTTKCAGSEIIDKIDAAY